MAYKDKYGVEFTDDQKTLIRCPKDFKGSYVIPDSVTEIESDAFSGCTGLSSIEIPNSVTKIGDWAFRGCKNMTLIKIPNSVTNIGHGAFMECEKLPIIDNIRYADTFLVEVIDKALTTYKIKEGTKWIGNEAFSRCTGLTSIEIPDSVTEIGGGGLSMVA